jgi:lia operon protein LiaF
MWKSRAINRGEKANPVKASMDDRDFEGIAMRRHISFGNLFIASIFILIGAWLLLSNMGLIDTSLGALLDIFLAAAIFVYGLWSIFVPLLRRRRPHWFAGVFGTAYGGLLLADYFHWLSFRWSDFWKLWPLLFVYIGLEMISGSVRTAHGGYERKRRRREGRGSTAVYDEGYREYKASNRHGTGTSVFNFVKEYRFNEPNWPVEPMAHWSMVGDYEMDFTQAFIPDRETAIRLSGWVGDIDIIIPEDVAFQVRGEASILNAKIDDRVQDGVGGRDIFYQTPDFEQATRRLIFDLDFKILDLRIDRI